ELGATVSRDGRHLFLSSNRPGGQGGFDLYVSEWTGSRWGKPVNMGTAVNTRDHEHDPALAPDGLALYFASNRASGQPRFDLFVSRRGSPQETWTAPQPLEGINLPSSNQRGPHLSPSGNFLY